MRVLVLHNRYRQPGGEDRAVETETEMLRERGVNVLSIDVNNNGNALRLLAQSSWSEHSYQEVSAICREFRPDVAHIHNFWMALTPAAHDACRDEGVPVVQTLHNFRLLCANALFLRGGQPCTECLGHAPWRGIVRRCYNGSAVASAAVARMVMTHRRRDTWSQVHRFITPSAYAKSLFVAGGFDAGRITVKPNPVNDPGPSEALPSQSQTVVYAGRLSPEKGLDTLLDAWREMPAGELLIIGDGSWRPDSVPDRVTFAGSQNSDRVIQTLRGARALVLPSRCYETFGNAAVEAFACGRPAVVSDLGALSGIVEHRRTGLKFRAGDARQLAKSLAQVLMNGGLADQLGANARTEYLAQYTPSRNFELLMEIYANTSKTRVHGSRRNTNQLRGSRNSMPALD